MNNPTFTTRLPGTREIHELVLRTRRLLRLSWVATGLGATLVVFLGLLLIACAVDLVAPLGAGLRLLAFVAVVGGGLVAYFHGVVRPIVRPLLPTQVARRIEGHLPGIRNRLVSCVDLMSDAAALSHSAAFCRRLVEETNARVAGFSPRWVLNLVRLRWVGALSIVGLLLLTAGLWVLPERLPITLKRVFAPLADIPPMATVQYSVWPGTTKLLRGDDLTFTVRVDRGQPERLTVEIESDNGGRPLRYDLQPSSAAQTWTFTLLGFPHSFDYRVVGGGTWSPRYRVTLLDRPTITGFHTVLRLPSCLG
ncbi:hypothetical protein HQ590_02470, partial [bacterium]|nr:hypothetical protein [bacterium]